MSMNTEVDEGTEDPRGQMGGVGDWVGTRPRGAPKRQKRDKNDEWSGTKEMESEMRQEGQEGSNEEMEPEIRQERREEALEQGAPKKEVPEQENFGGN